MFIMGNKVVTFPELNSTRGMAEVSDVTPLQIFFFLQSLIEAKREFDIQNALQCKWFLSPDMLLFEYLL